MKATLNLTDNPFDPELHRLGRRSGDPLRPDLYPEESDRELQKQLRDLLCMRVAGMAEAEERLRFALFGDNNAENAPVQRDAILLIVGPYGSGRTTLANLLATRILRTNRPAAGSRNWQRFDLEFDPYLPPPDVPKILDQKHDEIKGKLSTDPGKYLLVVEDLPEASFKFVLRSSRALSSLERVFIVTTTETELLKHSALEASRIHVEAVELRRLSEEDVCTLIKDRIPRYRASGEIPALQNQPELMLFPFSESAARAIAPKPFQHVRTWAYKRIYEKHKEVLARQGLVDVERADLLDLLTRLI